MLDILKSQKPYVVQGAAQGAYPRLEVEELMKNEYQWSLFMQAMRSLQQKGYKPKPASWQEIGGIHGLPYTRWSGDPAGPAQPDDTNIPDSDSPGKTKTQWQGYCYHSSVLFPPWHRVYMLLVEQAVTVEAKAIADKLVKDKNMPAKEREDWQDAACKLRFPYWDWSAVEAKDHGLPQIFMDATTTVRGPINTKLTLDPNPISRFDLNEIPKGAFDSTDVGVYFTKWKRTYRWAKPVAGATTGEGYKEDYDELRKALLQGLSPQEQPPIPRPFIPISSMCDKLRRMFSFPLTDDKKMFAIYWDRFAGTAPQSYNDAPETEQNVINSYVSLEDPHNSIHLDVGGSGDMGYDEMASFDPIFFFHHCNVDRHQALWEYCYPDYWLGDGYYDIVTGKGPTPFYDRDGAYQTVPRQPTLTEKTTLAPFRKNKTKYWDCTDVRGVKSVLKTYTYEPMHIKVKDKTVTIDISKPASLAQRKTYIAALQSYFADVSTPAANPQTKLALPALFHPPPTAPLPIPGTHKAVHGYRDFVVTAALQQFAFAGSHRLEVFVDGQFVAELSVFSRLNPEKCANCATRIAAGNAVVRGALGIPHAAVVHVLEKEGLNKKGTSEDGVVGALKKHLSARIVAPNGAVLALHVALAAFTSPPTSPAASPLASPSTASPLTGGGGEVLKREHCPVLTLVSSGVALSAGDVLEPRECFDWRHHGVAVEGVWCRA